MKKENLINCVITIDKNGNDKCYGGEYCSQFETVRELYNYFYDLIRKGRIKRFLVLDSFPSIYVNFQDGNIVKKGVEMEFLVKTDKNSSSYEW
tara:strand:- start:1706 stop:1984 length:279 start_codon:yes stop_codon:yes gene_type:complete